MNKRTFDPLKGKEVLITGGQYKGYRGKVCQIDDRQAMVEVSSLCKKIPVPRELLMDQAEVKKREAANGGSTTRGEDDPYAYGGRTVYEGGKTPLPYNTPS